MISDIIILALCGSLVFSCIAIAVLMIVGDDFPELYDDEVAR